MLLSKEQRIGAAVLFGIALAGWIAVAVWPSRQPDFSNLPDPPQARGFVGKPRSIGPKREHWVEGALLHLRGSA